MDLKDLLSNIDSNNLEILYKEYRDPIFLFVLSITKNYELSEDITEETFIRIIKYNNTYNRLKNPKTWIYTIAKNTAYSALKKHKEVPTDNEGLIAILDKHNTVKNESSLEIEEYLAHLNNDERLIVILYIFAGLKHNEIAKILKMSHESVRSKYSYALKKLRRDFHE